MNVPARIANRFEFGAFFAQGGMGRVYRGIDTQTGEPVAIKQLKPEILADNPDLLARFAAEGSMLATLNHPNIVKLLAMAQEDGQHYLVLEFVEGGSLADVLTGADPLPLARVLDIALDLADALTRTHRLNILHRDLKPANVLIATDGTPRLTDFGVARWGKSTVTGPDQIVGTLSYLSPEALHGEAIDERSDLWAFGLILFEMLTGKHPFPAVTTAAQINAILYEPVPDLEDLRPDLPVGLIDLVYRLLEKDRQRRIANIRLVGAELDALRTGSSGTVAVAKPAVTDLAAEVTQIISTPTPTPPALHNLPEQPTAFVGRDSELAELANFVADPTTRLVTILGPGGMGKTRLALEAASAQIAHFRDGVYFAALAPLSDPTLIPTAIAEAVRFTFGPGDTPKNQLLNFLRDKQLLLILDNFEHLLAGISMIPELLQAAPGIKLLVTSRERLHLQSETVYRIEGLTFSEWTTVQDIAESGTGKLFLQSARRVQPSFELTTKTLRDLNKICRLVRGMPLGILLAASWIDTLSVAEIAQEIERSFDFLEGELRDLPERQRSLRAVFEYSWNLLNDAERAAMRCFSIFRGGFTREAAQQVAEVSLKTLTSLVNKSLLSRDPAGRFDMHELLRQYSAEQLDLVGEVETIQHVHAGYYATFMVGLEASFNGPGLSQAVERINVDWDNVRAACTWLINQRDFARFDTIIDTLWLYGIDYRIVEVQVLWQQALDQFAPRTGENPSSMWGRLLSRTADVFEMRGPTAALASGLAHERVSQALAIAQRDNNKVEIGRSLASRGLLFNIQGNFNEGLRWYTDSLPFFEQVGDRSGLSSASNWIGVILRMLGRLEDSLPAFQQHLTISRELGDDAGVAWALWGIGITYFDLGRSHEAAQAVQESRILHAKIGNTIGLAQCATSLAWMALLKGDLEQARSNIESSLRLMTDAGAKYEAREVLRTKGRITLLKGDLTHARQIFDELAQYATAQKFMNEPDHFNLVLLYCAEGNFRAAKESIIALLQQGIEKHDAFQLMNTLPAQVIILAHQGSMDQATELIGLIAACPVHYMGWTEKWQMFTDTRAELESKLGTQLYQKAFERGRTLDLDMVVAELLKDD